MKVFIVLSVLVVAAVAQYAEIPIPYSFNYAADTEDGGGSSHQESSDGSGKVVGSYTVSNLEGHTRVVDYVADENGFRASIRTNEPGTANQNPADVVVESSAEGAGQAPAMRSAPVAPAGRQQGVRYVLVPMNDPRLSGY